MMIIKSLRILIIAGLWHIATALANLLTGYILQVKGIFLQSLKRNLILHNCHIDFQYLSLVGVMASSAVCILLSLVYTIFLMRGKQLEKKISLRDVLNLTTFKDGLGLLFRKRERGRRMVIITIICICILCQFSWGTRWSLLFLVHLI